MATKRRAFTLMEVLISIGVVAIGLLGVVQLLPLAYHQAFVGTQEDRKAIVGRKAFADLRIREFHNLQTWIDGTGNQFVPSGDRQSFCLDPLFLAYNPSEQQFPYGGGVMPRITTRMGRVSGAPSTALAEAAIVVGDDLEYETPSDALSLPMQVDAAIPNGRWNGSNAGGKRQNGGRFAWFATFSPDVDNERDMYVVSVVVTYNRIRTRMLTDSSGNTTDPREERALDISFPGGGFSGGDCLLATRGGPADDLLRIRAGDWIMVSGQTNASGVVTFHKWYRVVQAEAEVGGTGPYNRNVTLLGPDWSPTWTATQATVVEGAVGVYSKTIRFETSSLWKAQ